MIHSGSNETQFYGGLTQRVEAWPVTSSARSGRYCSTNCRDGGSIRFVSRDGPEHRER